MKKQLLELLKDYLSEYNELMMYEEYKWEQYYYDREFEDLINYYQALGEDACLEDKIMDIADILDIKVKHCKGEYYYIVKRRDGTDIKKHSAIDTLIIEGEENENEE